MLLKNPGDIEATPVTFENLAGYESRPVNPSLPVEATRITPRSETSSSFLSNSEEHRYVLKLKVYHFSASNLSRMECQCPVT